METPMGIDTPSPIKGHELDRGTGMGQTAACCTSAHSFFQRYSAQTSAAGISPASLVSRDRVDAKVLQPWVSQGATCGEHLPSYGAASTYHSPTAKYGRLTAKCGNTCHCHQKGQTLLPNVAMPSADTAGFDTRSAGCGQICTGVLRCGGGMSCEEASPKGPI